MNYYISFTAGEDYLPQEVDLEEIELLFTSATPTSSFSVDIIQDDLTELQESFFVMITGFDVFDSDGDLLNLTSDDQIRIRFSIDTAQVLINDSNSKCQDLYKPGQFLISGWN